MAPDIQIARRRGQKASVTLVSLCLTAALGIALGSYLALCSRSGNLNASLLNQDKVHQLAKVGLEEALWALNENNWTSSGPTGSAVWTTVGADRTVTLSYTLPGQSGSAQVVLRVANYASVGPTWPMITSVATISSGGRPFSKTLQAETVPAPLFGNAIASAESFVSFVAAGTVDSWNSDPDNNPATPVVPYSFTAGNAANYNAVIAGRGAGNFGVSLTQATVRGYVATFGLPVSHSTSGSPACKVLGPVTPANVNIDSSRLGKSAFVPVASVFNVSPPACSGPYYGGIIGNIVSLLAKLLALPTATVFKTSGDLNVKGGLFFLTDPNIVVDRPMKIIVTGDFNVTNVGRVTIVPGGSLQLFVEGDVTIGANGIDNQTKDPQKLAIFCTGSSTTDAIEYTTSADFCGVIFSENKPIDIRQNATFYGALLSRQYVRFSTNATEPVFHYDTALRKARFEHITTPYIIQKVTES